MQLRNEDYLQTCVYILVNIFFVNIQVIDYPSGIR